MMEVSEDIKCFAMIFILLLISTTEARVFCEDSNAMAWAAIGYSCPVLCGSVRNAIERLIMLDYKKSIQEQLANRKENNQLLNDINSNVIKNPQSSRQNSITDKGPFKKVVVNKEIDPMKTLPNPENIMRYNKYEGRNDTVNETYSNTKKKCWYLSQFKRNLLIGKIARRECSESRRSNFDGKFISIMTNVLNEYADSVFKFTEEMTEILLENIFGQNTDLRNNILDVNKLLRYLRKSVDLHKSHSHVITLKSRNCLTISVPGCYCKTGYVEHSGQCVKPSDCVRDDRYRKYLKRIIVM